MVGVDGVQGVALRFIANIVNLIILSLYCDD